ncbi:hypothetical protein ACLKA6_017515 [Drosophila palustris]
MSNKFSFVQALESLRRVAAATIKAANSVKLCAANKRILNLQAAAETLLATPRGIVQHTHTHTSGVARGRTRSLDNWFFDNLFAAETLLCVAISGFVSLFR